MTTAASAFRRKGKDGEGARKVSRTPEERILDVALRLLAEGGRDALTTRAVAEAAGVQPPTLYRLFQDKRGLLNALSDYGYALYFSEKRSAAPGEDPVQFLREGWTRHVQFGLSHPELYLLMYADPQPGGSAQAGRHAHAGLHAHMRAIAATGRLRIPEERATEMFHAAACGVVLSLLAVAEDARDMALSTMTCDAVLAALVTTDARAAESHVSTAAIALRAQLLAEPSANSLTPAEKTLLLQWLQTLSAPSQS